MTLPTRVNYCPEQPHIGGGDGYGRLHEAISGVAMRHNVTTVDPNWDGIEVPGLPFGVPRTLIPAVHQVNVTDPNPFFYFPRLDGEGTYLPQPGETWRFSCMVAFYRAVQAAGETHFRFSIEWYNAAGTYIHGEDGPWTSELSPLYTGKSKTGILVVGEFVNPPDTAEVRVLLEMKCPSPVNAWAAYDVWYELGPFSDPLPEDTLVRGETFVPAETDRYLVDWVDGKPAKTRYEVTMNIADVEFYDAETQAFVRLADKLWRLQYIHATPGNGDPEVTQAPYTWNYSAPELYTARIFFNFVDDNVTKSHSFTVNQDEWIAAGQAAIAEWEAQNPGLTWDPAWNWPGSLL